MTENTTSPTGRSSVDLVKQCDTLWQARQNQSEAIDVYLASLRTRPLRIDHICAHSVVRSKVRSSSYSTRRHASFYCARACLRDQVAYHSDLEKKRSLIVRQLQKNSTTHHDFNEWFLLFCSLL